MVCYLEQIVLKNDTGGAFPAEEHRNTLNLRCLKYWNINCSINKVRHC